MEPEHQEETEVENVVLSGNLLDSRTSQLDDVLNEKLEQVFDGSTTDLVVHELTKIGSEYDPIDLAYAVTRLPPSIRAIVYENLPDLQAKVIFMNHTGSNTRAAVFRSIDNRSIKELLEAMPPDEAVWMLDDMSDRRSKRILEVLDRKKASRIVALQKHDRHSAGRLMTDEFFSFPMNATIGEVAKQIRDRPGIVLTRRIFVLNEGKELVGYVPSRNLIVNPHHFPLRQVMRPIVHKVTAETSRDEVVDLVERYEIPVLPVVDDKESIVGVITFEDVVEAMEDIADETIATIAGTGEDVSEHDPIIKRVLLRSPWLVVTLCSGLVTAAAMSHFDGRLWFMFVPFFVPLITGMSGNVGIQCSTILVRAMSTGEISLGFRREAALKEMTIGLLIGSFFGLFCAFVVYNLSHFGIDTMGTDSFVLGVTVGSGVFAACLNAALLGAVTPFFFARCGIDPAIAAGPIVTAFNDLVSTLVFFGVARMIYLFFV